MSPSAALGQEGLSDFRGLTDPDSLEEGWTVMHRLSPLLASLMFFSLLVWACGFGEEDHRGEVPFSSCPARAVLQYDSSPWLYPWSPG